MSASPPLDALIVDDHAPMRVMMRRILEKSGVVASIREARQAAEAITLLNESGAGLVLCDQSMPGMSGVELIGALRADPRHARTCILLISGHADTALAERARAAGANGVLVKPISARALLEAIQRGLNAS